MYYVDHDYRLLTSLLRADVWQHCNTWQLSASHCNIPQHTATHCNTLRHTCTDKTWRVTSLQHIATLCITLQHTTTLCDTLVQLKADVYLHDNIYSNMKIWGIKRRLTWRSWSTSSPRRYDVPVWEHIPIYINMKPSDSLYTWVYVLFCRM